MRNTLLSAVLVAWAGPSVAAPSATGVAPHNEAGWVDGEILACQANTGAILGIKPADETYYRFRLRVSDTTLPRVGPGDTIKLRTKRPPPEPDCSQANTPFRVRGHPTRRYHILAYQAEQPK